MNPATLLAMAKVLMIGGAVLAALGLLGLVVLLVAYCNDRLRRPPEKEPDHLAD